MSSALKVRSQDVTVAALDAATAFQGLSSGEASYAHSLYDAAWAGAKICLLQCSAESAPTFVLLLLVSNGGFGSLRQHALSRDVSVEEFDSFAAWAASFFDNMGNYRSFGDTKILPTISVSVFETIVRASPAYALNASLLDELLAAIMSPLFSEEPRTLQMGLAPSGISTYFSSNMTEADSSLVDRWITSVGLDQPYNSRVFKLREGHYQFRWASAQTSAEGAPASLLLGSHHFEGATIDVIRGDYAPVMARVVDALRRAKQHAANDTQRAMMDQFAASFSEGTIADHVEGSKLWVADVSPAVETYQGFIESYRDPVGTRGEWEGLVAVVNKAQSAKFGALVDAAPSLLAKLPWGPLFEKDAFKRPDFTFLDVLAFGSSGIPAGINIPNYDSVRQSVGFKNVSLGNVLSARDIKERVTFLAEEDQVAYRTLVNSAFEVQVGLHELLGHGSGKVFVEDSDGKLNFDMATVTDPATGAPVTSWYRHGQTWDTVFGGLASTMEECRAEGVGLHLCVFPEVLSIFGHPVLQGQQEVTDITYVNWLNMARAGLLALQFYTPATGTWGQAHMQARYALLQVMLRAGGGLVDAVAAGTVIEGDGGVHVRLDRSKILSVGVPAIASFLRQLQVYKSTADVAAAGPWYRELTSVPDAMLPLRDLVVAKRRPRQAFVQPILEPAGMRCAVGSGSTVITSPLQSEVQMRMFPATADGLIDAAVARFAPGYDEALLSLWRAERHMHKI